MEPEPKINAQEQLVLEEYSRLVDNLEVLNARITTLAHLPTSQVLDNLRVVERKTGLVFTLFKSSVWAILADLPGDHASDQADE